MFKVNNGHSVTLGGLEFKSGRTLPAGRDYSSLILLGVVIETKHTESGARKTAIEEKFGYEPSMIKITREKVKKEKAIQTAAKIKRKKDKEPKEPKKPKAKGGK